MIIAGITLLLFITCTLLGFSLVYALALSTLFFAFIEGIPLSILTQTAFTSLDNFTYVAIPLFLFVGNLMDSGGLSQKLIGFSSRLFSKVPGRLGAITVLSCAFFGAISGSASATTAAIGGMMIPEMHKQKYPPGYSGALAATSGTLGAMIPPSIVMIIYAVIAEVSVADMFIAGFLPGIIIALALIIANCVFALIKRIDVAHSSEKISFKNIMFSFWDAKWALLSPVIVLGGIYSGVFTATEAAVIATVYSFIVGVFIHREITRKEFMNIVSKTCKTIGAVIILIPFASTLARLLTLTQVPQQIGGFVLSITQNPSVILMIIIVLVFITGMFLDATPIILIYTPLFLPVLQSMGVSPIHFGIIITLGAMIGAVTPPVGINLFIAQGIAKVNSFSIMKYELCFIILFMLLYVFIALNPWISLSLISLLR